MRQFRALPDDHKTQLISELEGSSDQQLSETVARARALSAESQAQLITALLSDSGMSVIFANGDAATAGIVSQIQATDPERIDVSDVLSALAERIRPKRATE